MNKYHYLGTLIFSLFLSCSDSAIKESLLIPETLVPIDGFDDDPLGIVQSFSEGLSLKEQRISAFVNGNRRVSIIDTENLREKWGRSLDYEFSRSFPIPDLDGVFLISQERMLLVTENEEHFIDLNGSRYNRYARSEQQAVYVALNGDSGDFLVARRDQGGGISQQEIVLAQANVNHSSRGPGDYSFIPFIDPLGTRVLVLEQNSGAYFMIGASISELDADQLRCLPAKFESDGPVPEEELIKLTAGSLNKEGSKLIFATSSHRLGQIDIDGTCKDLYDAAEAGL